MGKEILSHRGFRWAIENWFEPEVIEVVEALISLGGAGDPARVARFVAQQRGGAIPSAGLQAMLLEVVRHHRIAARRRGLEPLFEDDDGFWRLTLAARQACAPRSCA